MYWISVVVELVEVCLEVILKLRIELMMVYVEEWGL